MKQLTKPQLLNLRAYAQVGIFIQALVATMGSLYFSTFGDPLYNLTAGNFFPVDHGFKPCVLCWFARIFMYPQVILSYLGIYKKDVDLPDYVLALSIPGLILELYQYGLQMFGAPHIVECGSDAPCSGLQVQYAGFITIPFLALTAFTVIIILALLSKWSTRQLARAQTTTSRRAASPRRPVATRSARPRPKTK